MALPTGQQIYAAILASAKVQRSTHPTITMLSDLQSGTYQAVLADDSLLDKIARNASQSVIGALPDDDDVDDILAIARDVAGAALGGKAELLADKVIRLLGVKS